MRTARLSRWRATAVAAAAATCLGGCLPGAPGRLGGAQTCVSWVGYETPADAAADAELAVTARVDGRDGTQPLYGVAAAAYTVTVIHVLEPGPEVDGAELDEAVPDRLRVISTPVTCTGTDDDYPDGDPLDTDATVALFLTRDSAGGHWRTLTPFHGIVPVTQTGGLPAAWPDVVP